MLGAAQWAVPCHPHASRIQGRYHVIRLPANLVTAVATWVATNIVLAGMKRAIFSSIGLNVGRSGGIHGNHNSMLLGHVKGCSAK